MFEQKFIHEVISDKELSSLIANIDRLALEGFELISTVVEGGQWHAFLKKSDPTNDLLSSIGDDIQKIATALEARTAAFEREFNRITETLESLKQDAETEGTGEH